MVEIIYVTAKWCGPCKSMKPIINELIESGFRITTIDADVDKEFSTNNGIFAIPTFLYKKDGVVVHRLTGIQNKDTLLQKYEEIKAS